jgi:hypothetical protein
MRDEIFLPWRRTLLSVRRFLPLLLLLALLRGGGESVLAGWADEEEVPNRFGVGLVYGNTFNPVTDISFLQVTAFGLFDYDKVWRHPAPRGLRFKVEASFGLTIHPGARTVAAVNMLALYHLRFLAAGRVTPYIEGGIGGIYTDFQAQGKGQQGSRINFNPLLGVGLEVAPRSGPPFFAAVRLHHLSNAGLRRANQGVDSALLMVGRFLK